MLRKCIACERTTEAEPPPVVCDGCGCLETLIDVTPHAERAPRDDAPPRSLAEDVEPVPLARCGIAEVDRLLSDDGRSARAGGFALEATTLLYGGPGSGKSTLSLRCAAGLALALDTRAVVACPEMSHKMLTNTCRRGNVDASRLFRAEEPGDWERKAHQLGARVLLVDSITEMRAPATTLVRIVEWCRSGGRVALVLSQVNSENKPAGPMAIRHKPDAVLYLAVQKNGERRLFVQKSRTAPLGSVSLA